MTVTLEISAILQVGILFVGLLVSLLSILYKSNRKAIESAHMEIAALKSCIQALNRELISETYKLRIELHELINSSIRDNKK